MKGRIVFILLFIVLIGCKNNSYKKSTTTIDTKLALGEEFIEAFYSYDNERLRSILSKAEKSQPNILYYQKWAECGNYRVVDRAKTYVENDSTLVVPVTVKDDLMAALNIDFNVTDTFRLTIRDKSILAVNTSSNDPDFYYEAKDWVKKNRKEFIEVPCEGIWDSGPTPCDCIKGMINGFGEFMKDFERNGAQEKQ